MSGLRDNNRVSCAAPVEIGVPIPTPSCLAIRQALTSLYRLDDFHLEPIGAGFFSQVYKVVYFCDDWLVSVSVVF